MSENNNEKKAKKKEEELIEKYLPEYNKQTKDKPQNKSSSKLYGKPNNETVFVFNIIPATRRSWHRHYCFKCRSCGTFLRFKCDKNDAKNCSQHTHNRKGSWNYKTNREYAPDFIRISMEEFDKNEKGNKCTQHFRH